MPIIRSAEKALRQEKKRNAVNSRIRRKVKLAVDAIRIGATDSKSLSQAYSALDTAAKTNVIHHKKADRLKSRLSAAAKRGAVKPAKKVAAKKTTAKKKAVTA